VVEVSPYMEVAIAVAECEHVEENDASPYP
jgi:hypothetical protein